MGAGSIDPASFLWGRSGVGGLERGFVEAAIGAGARGVDGAAELGRSGVEATTEIANHVARAGDVDQFGRERSAIGVGRLGRSQGAAGPGDRGLDLGLVAAHGPDRQQGRHDRHRKDCEQH